MALTNMYFKTKLVSCFGGKERNRREREEEGEKKRKRKRRWRSQDQGQKGMDAWILVWNLDFWYENQP